MMLNYRTHQILTLVAATDLQSYVENLDTRITYSAGVTKLRDESLFRPEIKANYTVPGAAIYLSGTNISPDASGLCAYSYHVSVDGNYLNISRTLTPVSSTSTLLTFNNGLSQEIPLPYSNFKVRVNAQAENCSWQISGNYRPTLTLAKIDESLRKTGDDILTQLFGASKAEPYATFYNCWKDHPEFAYRFAGLIMSYIYRVEEVRSGR
jgi:hypothetical protein